jgi:chloramphenicol 3-O phosphotransferase
MKIIVLNGTSSSGKSSIARELQTLLPEPYLHLGIDTFIGMLPSRYFGVQTPAEEGFLLFTQHGGTEIRTGPVGQRLLRGMYQSFAALAAAGNNLIVDHVLLDRQGLAGLVEALADFPVLFVGIHCPLEVLLERERGRPERTAGMAAAQYTVVHAHCLYDLEVDSSAHGPRDAALVIRDRLESSLPFTALQRLRRDAGGDGSA